MTLIVTVNGPESIWLLSDRRLSLGTRSVRDNARKVMFLKCTDGDAIIGYAGLGATALGTEPSDWMSSVLCGRNLPLEQSLGVLAEAMNKQFHKHLKALPRNGSPAHNVVITAFIDGETRYYMIDMALTPDRKAYDMRWVRSFADQPNNGRPPIIGLAGSGGTYLFREKKWMRTLLRVVKTYDRGRISEKAVTNHLANLNHEVHSRVNSVGPRCIVAWRHRENGVHKGFGGGHAYYTGTDREPNSPSLPSISHGINDSALINVLMPHIEKRFEARRQGEPVKEWVDEDGLNKDLAKVPDAPDENLR